MKQSTNRWQLVEKKGRWYLIKGSAKIKCNSLDHALNYASHQGLEIEDQHEVTK